MLSSCALLPDSMYVEASEPNPNPDGFPLWESDPTGGPVLALGFGWQLQPQRVVIAGQEARHPWDVFAAANLYDPEEDDEEPVPVVVEDPNTRILREAFDDMAAEWHAVNRTLLGGGGLGTLILLLVGGRAYLRRRDTPKPEEG